MIREVLSLERLRDMPPDEAAATLIVRRSDGAGGLDEQTLRDWLELDPAHPRAWEMAEQAWKAFDEAVHDNGFDALRREAVRARPTGKSHWPRWAAAAVFVMTIGGSWALIDRTLMLDRNPEVAARRTGADPDSPAPVRYATVRGEQRDVTLADGSRVTLDTQTSIEVRFTAANRRVVLQEGRAFFAVEPDVERPFSVTADTSEVTVLGTRFDVRLDPGQLRVTLVEGKVEVGSGEGDPKTTVLRPGQQFVQRSGAPPIVSAARVDKTMDWQRGIITFQNDTLANATAELNRYTRDQLVVRDPAVADLRISGTFRTGDPARFARTLAEIHPVTTVRDGAGRLEIVAASPDGSAAAQ